MDRKRKDIGVAAKNSRCAVAMVHVGIDDERLADRTIRLEAADADGHIVDGAESFAVIRIGMMESAAEIATEAVTQCRLRGEDRAAGSEPEGFNELWRVRHLKPHFFAGGQGSGLQLTHPICRVNTKNVFVRGRVWRQEIVFCGDSLAQQQLGNETEFLRRKNVFAEIQVVAFVIDQFERQHRVLRDQYSRSRMKSGRVRSARANSESTRLSMQALARRA